MLNVIRFVLETTLFNKSVIEGFKTLWHCFVTMFNCVISMASWILLYLYSRPLQSQMFAPILWDLFPGKYALEMFCVISIESVSCFYSDYWSIFNLFDELGIVRHKDIHKGSIDTMVPSYSTAFWLHMYLVSRTSI